MIPLRHHQMYRALGQWQLKIKTKAQGKHYVWLSVPTNESKG